MSKGSIGITPICDWKDMEGISDWQSLDKGNNEDPDCLPSNMDAGFNKWTNKGFIYIAQVFNGPIMMFVEQLAQEFNLPTHDLYKCLHFRYCLQRHKEWEHICKEPTKQEELLMS